MHVDSRNNNPTSFSVKIEHASTGFLGWSTLTFLGHLDLRLLDHLFDEVCRQHRLLCILVQQRKLRLGRWLLIVGGGVAIGRFATCMNFGHLNDVGDPGVLRVCRDAEQDFLIRGRALVGTTFVGFASDF